MDTNILDVLDDYAILQKNQKKSLSFKTPIFNKKVLTPPLTPPNNSELSQLDHYDDHSNNYKSSSISQRSNNQQLEIVEQKYNFSLSNIVENSMRMRPNQPETKLFETPQKQEVIDDDPIFYVHRKDSFQDMNDEIDNEIKEIQSKIQLQTTVNKKPSILSFKQKQDILPPNKSRMSILSNQINFDIREQQEDYQSQSQTSNSDMNSDKRKIKQPNRQSKTPVKLYCPEELVEPKPLIQINIELAGQSIQISVHKNTTIQDIENQLSGKIQPIRLVHIQNIVIEKIDNYVEQLQNYLKINGLQDVKKENFISHCRNNRSFLCNLETKNNISTPKAKKSLSQITRDLFYNRNKSMHSFNTPNNKSSTSLKSQSPQRRQKSTHEASYYDFNVSPFCTKHIKMKTLMNDPPNISTCKETNQEQIHINSKVVKNEFVTFEITLGAGRVGKITFNRRKINDEFNIQILHSKLNTNKKLIKQQEVKEIAITIEKFCIRHKLNTKQKIRIGKILPMVKILEQIP